MMSVVFKSARHVHEEEVYESSVLSLVAVVALGLSACHGPSGPPACIEDMAGMIMCPQINLAPAQAPQRPPCARFRQGRFAAASLTEMRLRARV